MKTTRKDTMLRTSIIVMVSFLVGSTLASVIPVKGQVQSSCPNPMMDSKVSSVVTVTPSYTPILLLSGLSGPRGVGVHSTGAAVLFNTQYDLSLWAYYKGSQSLILTTPAPLHASRMISKYYVVGDDAGNVFVLLRDGSLKLLTSLGGGFITGLDIDKNGDIYFVELLSSVLYKLPRGSSTPVAIAILGFSCWGVAVKGNTLFVSDTYGGNIYALPKTGGSLTLFVSGLNGPTDLIYDMAGNLYGAEFFGGSIFFIKAGTQIVERIATGFTNPYYIGLDAAGNVYFTDFGSNELWKLASPP